MRWKRFSVDTQYENDYCYLTVHHKPMHQSPPGTERPRVSSETLLGARRELVILHNGREYFLRLTQNGKLILTA
jgi:hemin uptake protein HemP